MRLPEGHFEDDSVPGQVDLDPLIVGMHHPYVSPVTECDRPDIPTQVRLEQGLVRRQDCGLPGLEARDQLGLGRGDCLDRSQHLQMHGADAHDHADVRLGDRGQLGDLAAAPHGQLEHQHLGVGRRGEDLERNPDLRVEVRPRGHRTSLP